MAESLDSKEIRQQHRSGEVYCQRCGEVYPCATTRLLDALEVESRVVEASRRLYRMLQTEAVDMMIVSAIDTENEADGAWHEWEAAVAELEKVGER